MGELCAPAAGARLRHDSSALGRRHWAIRFVSAATASSSGCVKFQQVSASRFTSSCMAPKPPGGIDPSEVPALFWDELPEDESENSDAAALKAIIEDTSPEERAEGFKESAAVCQLRLCSG